MRAAAAIRELERVAIFAQTTRGRLPEAAPARRPMTPVEMASGINFAAMDRNSRSGYAASAEVLAVLRRAIIADLAKAIGNRQDPREVAAAVTAWAVKPTPAVQQAMDTARRAMRVALRKVADEAAAGLRAEAVHQGVKPRKAKLAAGDFEDALDGEATLPVAAMQSRLSEAAMNAAQRPGTPDKPLAAVDGASTKGAEDLARQSVNIATGAGRAEEAARQPEPSQCYASELLDNNICDNCEQIDGTEYGSVAEAEVDYPGLAGYYDCEGGARCRGTVVLVWDEQSDDEDGGGTDGGGPNPDGPMLGPDEAPPEGEGDLPEGDTGETALPDGAPGAEPVVEPPPLEPTQTPVPPPGGPEVPGGLSEVLDLGPRALRKVSDDDLGQALTHAFETDHPAADKLIAELDRREEAPLREAKRLEIMKVASQARRDVKKEAEWAQVAKLIEGGADPREAVADVTGVSVEKQLKAELTARLKAEGVPGVRLDDMITRKFKDEVYRAYIDAENQTRTHMLTKEAEARGIDPQALFTGSDAAARKWASPELKEYWDQHGRPTFRQYREELINGMARQTRVDDYLI